MTPLTVHVRLRIGGQRVPMWRVRLLGWCARMLGVPVEVEDG